MNYIITGNLIALIASLLMVYSGIVKKKSEIIYIQTIQIFLSIVSNVVLGGITGAIVNAISCIRNVLCYKNKLGAKEKLFLILCVSLLSIRFNNLGAIGLLPLISTVIYTLLIHIKDVVKFKWVMVLTSILWFIYDLYIMSLSAIFDLSFIISNIVAIYQLKKYKGDKNNNVVK